MPILRSTDDVDLAVHDLGGDGPPLLWCHATGFHGRVYAPLARAIEGRHHWAIDFRGFGDSTEPSAPLRWEGFGEDVLTTLEFLRSVEGHAGPFDAVGHSKGGAAILLAELRAPGTFARAWCFEPIVFPSVGGPAGANNPMAESARRRRPAFPSFEAAIERYGSRPPLSIFDAECLELYVRHGFAPGDNGDVWIKGAPDFEAQTYEAARGHGAFERLAEIGTEVVVAASGDADGPATIAPMVADALPKGRIERFDDLTHFGPMQAPGRIAGAIAAFLG